MRFFSLTLFHILQELPPWCVWWSTSLASHTNLSRCTSERTWEKTQSFSNTNEKHSSDFINHHGKRNIRVKGKCNDDINGMALQFKILIYKSIKFNTFASFFCNHFSRERVQLITELLSCGQLTTCSEYRRFRDLLFYINNGIYLSQFYLQMSGLSPELFCGESYQPVPHENLNYLQCFVFCCQAGSHNH